MRSRGSLPAVPGTGTPVPGSVPSSSEVPVPAAPHCSRQLGEREWELPVLATDTDPQDKVESRQRPGKPGQERSSSTAALGRARHVPWQEQQ